MATLNILLGAGFSKPAGLPLVSDISKYFNRKIYDNLRMHSSGEWFWRDHGAEVENHNGSLNRDHILYAFVFEEILARYGEMKNYEEFYEFILSQSGEWFEEVFSAAKIRCQNELKLQPEHDLLVLFTTHQFQKVIEIFNYLIIDTLRIKMSDEELLVQYGPFLKFLEDYELLNLFTLNHDLLLERLFSLTRRKYSDGFTTEGSTIIGDSGSAQPCFQNKFAESTQIRKMHGSDGLYQYPAGIDHGGVIERTGEIIYFKPTSYRSKHMSKRVDEKGNTLQNLNLDPSPKFITGKNKNELIKKDPMYSALYSDFQTQLKKAADLMIVGYSYFDDHINTVLEKSTALDHVININPSKTYPYPNANKITNLKTVSDLST